MSMPSGSSAVSAAPISEPSSIVPVVSTVTEQISGNPPSGVQGPAGAQIEALVCSRSWVVSTSSASAPPAIRPSAFFW